jgi:hypothetical protein
MKNAREAAIKILENAKKALKEKVESLEKAEGKNTAQLNEFKGIPQPPTPKAPEKAIAPTPKIPQPKMPGLGKAAKPLSSFMQKKMQKSELNKAKIYDIKSKKMIADLGEPKQTTAPKGKLKSVDSKQQEPKKVAK